MNVAHAKPRGLPGASNPAYRPLAERFWEKVEKTAECWLWIGAVGSTGYGHIRADGKARTASRVAYELVHGAIPVGAFVLHRCDNPLCVNPAHLYAGTHSQNMADKVARGRAAGAVGERNCKAKLTADKVVAIRQSTVGTCELARRYGVNRNTIGRIRSDRQWRHL